MKCQESAQYGKDEFKNLHFYCNYCGKKMFYDEDRECTADPEKCECGALIGADEMAVSTCFNCDKEI